MFKEHKWKPYGQGRRAVSLDINVKDGYEQTIDYVKLRKGKEIDNRRMLRRIKKYGFNLDVPIEKEEDKETVESEKDKEIDWFRS